MTLYAICDSIIQLSNNTKKRSSQIKIRLQSQHSLVLKMI